jgi:hypothetical protein
MDGYYAINSYFIGMNFEIIEQRNGNILKINSTIELQITTQIQDLMRGLLHNEYKKTRIQSDNDDWVWKYKEDKFSTAYLAHMLHFAEGMIMQIMEKNKNSEE